LNVTANECSKLILIRNTGEKKSWLHELALIALLW